MCSSSTGVSGALNINQTSESRIVWCLEETDSCGSQREYDDLPGGSEATETQTRRRRQVSRQAGRQTRQTDGRNKHAVIKKRNKLAATLPTSAAARRANGRQIKLDYNSSESSAHCGQQSVFADLSALRAQICITTGGGGGFALFIFSFCPSQPSKILS